MQDMIVGTLDLAQIQQLENEHQPPLYAKREIALVRGEGPYLFDSDGRRYLDAMSNYGVAILGHADQEYAAALSEQLQILATGHQSFYSDVRAELLSEIGQIAPAGLTRYFLSNSGAEAVEAAIKFARVATGRPNLVAAKRGYHGRTLGALAATADQKYRAPFEPLAPHATHVSFNDVDALAAAVDDQTAAIVLEPIQGEGGIWPASPEYLQAAREIATAQGALLIADEIVRRGSRYPGHGEGVGQRVADRSDDVDRGDSGNDPERRPRHDVWRQSAGVPRRDRHAARAARTGPLCTIRGARCGDRGTSDRSRQSKSASGARPRHDDRGRAQGARHPNPTGSATARRTGPARGTDHVSPPAPAHLAATAGR